MNKNGNKDKIINLRVSKEQKEQIERKAKSDNKNISRYILDTVLDDGNITSHEKLITSSLQGNQLINDLLRSTDISDKTKKIISQEVRKYV